MIDEPSLAVVVPATDDAAFLDECLAAIDRDRRPADEVLVVRAPGARPVSNGTRVVLDIAYGGPSSARNAGARVANAGVLVFVDADVAITPGFLDRVRKSFAARPELDAIFGAYEGRAAGVATVTAFRNLLHHHVHASAAGPATTFWTGLGAIRRRKFLAVGGLDEDLRFLEDIELGARLTQSGARIELDPRLTGLHLKRYTLRDMVRTDLFERGVPWVRLILERRASSTALNAGGRHRTSAALVLASSAAAIRGRTALATSAGLGFLALNRDFHSLLRRRMGLRGAVAGPPLHALHLVSSVASIPIGALAYVRTGRRPRGASVPPAATGEQSS